MQHFLMAGNRLTNGLPSSVNPYFSYKNSLFAEVEKQKSTYKKCFIHRLVYIARINCTAGGAISGHYEQIMSKIQKNAQAEGITGLLLIYPEYIVHVIETSSEILTLVLEDLCNMEESSKPLLKDVRILVVSHCLFSRMFTSWAPQILTVTLSLQDSESQIEPQELLAQIYKLCTSLLRTKDNSLDLPAERALLMVEEAVRHLCQSTVLRSPYEFLQAYGKPINILMDSGRCQVRGISKWTSTKVNTW